MSAVQLSALLAAAAANADVRSALEAASSPREAADVATSLGYDVTVEDIDAHRVRAMSGELDDAELGWSAGGTVAPSLTINLGSVSPSFSHDLEP
jgi:predicted ribosomally synthesized peptide with nif11-like leader